MQTKKKKYLAPVSKVAETEIKNMICQSGEGITGPKNIEKGNDSDWDSDYLLW